MQKHKNTRRIRFCQSCQVVLVENSIVNPLYFKTENLYRSVPNRTPKPLSVGYAFTLDFCAILRLHEARFAINRLLIQYTLEDTRYRNGVVVTNQNASYTPRGINKFIQQRRRWVMDCPKHETTRKNMLYSLRWIAYIGYNFLQLS